MSLPRPVVSLPRRRPSDDSTPPSTSPFLHSTYKGRRASGNHRSLTLNGAATAKWRSFVITHAFNTRNVLLVLLLISLWFNWTGSALETKQTLAPTNVKGRVPLSIRTTLQSPHSNLKHLVLVPGHAIWTGCDASKATQDDTWILEDMQKGMFLRGVMVPDKKLICLRQEATAEIAVRDPEALLVFSGGMTRAHTDLTEAISYFRLAKAGNVFSRFKPEDDQVNDDFDRVTTEDYALDSFENVLFSIARFKEFTGRYPEKITAVGYGMKRRRYEDVHRAALRWPKSKFTYIGIDNDHDVEADYEGERKYGLEPWIKDLYGCHAGLLQKRRKRNLYRRFHPYHSSAPELSGLLEYCPMVNELYDGPLPWPRD
ncbi:hypothetical protein OIV83_003245 [Microbotryomycetes sp. JL201]|nr:hypothetical protein OIV83_003245 [Microbotryomycetes sp. JL201]